MSRNMFTRPKQPNSEPLGLKRMCEYICKFLSDEERIESLSSQLSNKYRRYYEIASQYPNNKQKAIEAFSGKYRASMSYGFESSELLESIIKNILTEEEKERARKRLEILYEKKYLLDPPCTEKASLEDVYIYYEYRKKIITISKSMLERELEYTDRKINRTYSDTGLKVFMKK